MLESQRKYHTDVDLGLWIYKFYRLRKKNMIIGRKAKIKRIKGGYYYQTRLLNVYRKKIFFCYKNYTEIYIENYRQVQKNETLMDEYIESAAIKLANQIDRKMAKASCGCKKVNSAFDYMTKEDLYKGAEKIDAKWNNHKPRLIVHTDLEDYIKSFDGFVPVRQRVQEPGFLGRIDNYFNVYSSPNIFRKNSGNYKNILTLQNGFIAGELKKNNFAVNIVNNGRDLILVFRSKYGTCVYNYDNICVINHFE